MKNKFHRLYHRLVILAAVAAPLLFLIWFDVTRPPYPVNWDKRVRAAVRVGTPVSEAVPILLEEELDIWVGNSSVQGKFNEPRRPILLRWVPLYDQTDSQPRMVLLVADAATSTVRSLIFSR